MRIDDAQGQPLGRTVHEPRHVRNGVDGIGAPVLGNRQDQAAVGEGAHSRHEVRRHGGVVVALTPFVPPGTCPISEGTRRSNPLFLDPLYAGSPPPPPPPPPGLPPTGQTPEPTRREDPPPPPWTPVIPRPHILSAGRHHHSPNLSGPELQRRPDPPTGRNPPPLTRRARSSLNKAGLTTNLEVA